MKIAVFEADSVSHNGDVDLSPILALGEVRMYNRVMPEDVVKTIGDAEVLIINKTQITREIMLACPNLKYIGCFATGYNVIDVKAADELGIYVVNAPAYSTESVAQFVFAFILEKATKLTDYKLSVDRGDWKNSKSFSYFPYPIIEIYGKTLGIVGYGSIGHAVARIAKAFGMKILVHTRTVRPEEGIEFVSLDTLLRESDFVSLNCPLTDETKGLINKETLAKMKPTAFLINTSRGGVICEEDLAEALISRKIAGAALDVLSVEPMRKDCPLFGIDTCTITPHVAWASIEARTRLIQLVVNGVKAYQNGKPINVVNNPRV